MRWNEREALVGLAMVAGCGGGDSDLVLEDPNNYTEVSDIVFGHSAIQEGADATIDWSALTTDLRGRPLDPTTVDQVVFSSLDMTEGELRDRVLANDIPQADAVSATFGNADHGTSVDLSELDALGNPFDVSTVLGSAGQTWIATLIEVPEDTIEQQVLYTVAVDPGAEPGPISMTDGATTVSVVPNLRDAAALHTVADGAPYTLDWSGLTVDVFGNRYDNTVANTLVIVNYPGSVADVEADFLLADYHASAVYRVDTYGYDSAKLESAVDVDGTAFPGFTSEGTWLVGLVDSQSLSPIPLVMAVVEVGK